MSIASMKQALEFIDSVKVHPTQIATRDALHTALRAAIEQAEKPVAWQGVHDHTDLYYRKSPQADVRPLYTTPPAAPRQWVGLTEEEIDSIDLPPSGTATVRDFIRLIEAKLKEKNHG